MIDITSSLISILSGIQAFGGRVYRAYPKTVPKIPFAVLTMTSHSAVDLDRIGRELTVRVSYQLDVFGSTATAAEALAGQCVDALAPYHLPCVGMVPMHDDSQRSYRVILSFSGVADSRGYIHRM